MNNNKLSEYINQIFQEKNLTIDRLAALTNIPKRYLIALKEGDFKNLPPAPYVRGYILKIAESLNIEADNLIEAYRELTLKSSGRDDALPTNRFAITEKPARRFLVLLIIILFFSLLLLRFTPNFRGVPEINVNLPEEVMTVTDGSLIIEGSVEPADAVFINGEPVAVDRNGRFIKEVMLENGQNTFEIKAKRFLGRETKIIRQVFYEERQQKNED